MARSWELSPGRKRNFRSALHQFLRKLTRFSARCLRNRPLSSPNHEISAGENGRTRRVRLVQRFHKIKTALFVCYWHLADILFTLANVCFWVESGHRSRIAECLLMTKADIP